MNGVKRIAVFDEFEGVDESLSLKVFKEFDDGVASVALFAAIGVFDSALEEQVVEGQGGRELLVSFDLDDSAQDVIFELDVHL